MSGAGAQQGCGDAVQLDAVRLDAGHAAAADGGGEAGQGEGIGDDGGEGSGQQIGVLGEQGQWYWFGCQPRGQGEKLQTGWVVAVEPVDCHRP